jgi:hypothetical protein
MSTCSLVLVEVLLSRRAFFCNAREPPPTASAKYPEDQQCQFAKAEIQQWIDHSQWYHEFDFCDGWRAEVKTPDALRLLINAS